MALSYAGRKTLLNSAFSIPVLLHRESSLSFLFYLSIHSLIHTLTTYLLDAENVAFLVYEM